MLGLRADGVLGPATKGALAALAAAPGADAAFVLAFAKERLRLMRDDIVADVTRTYGPDVLATTDLRYLGGWQARVIDVAFG